MDITSFKKEFDVVLKQELAARAKNIKALIKDSFVVDAALYPHELLLAGGKRIRPYLAYLMYRAGGGKKQKELLKLLTGLEVFHMFCLVHDDIADRAFVRHSLSPTHKYIVAQLKKESRSGDHGHMANSTAMLSGDLLFGYAYNKICMGEAFPEKHMKKVREHYNAMVERVILGEMLDVDTTTRRQVDRKTIQEKTYNKSAHYTFVSPLLLGLSYAGAKPASEKFCLEFGEALGMAFQIQDDYLDLTASSEQLHKPVLGDLRENVHTLFTWYIFEHGSSKDKKELDSLMGSSIEEADQAGVLDLFERTGALAYGQGEMEKCFKKARTVLKNSRLSVRDKEDFADLISYIEKREK